MLGHHMQRMHDPPHHMREASICARHPACSSTPVVGRASQQQRCGQRHPDGAWQPEAKLQSALTQAGGCHQSGEPGWMEVPSWHASQWPVSIESRVIIRVLDRHASVQ